MKLLGAVAVAGLVVAAVVTTYARSAGAGPEPAEAVPSAPTDAPGPRTGQLKVDPGSVGPAGLNVRYLDDDGKIQELGVKDFPR